VSISSSPSFITYKMVFCWIIFNYVVKFEILLSKWTFHSIALLLRTIQSNDLAIYCVSTRSIPWCTTFPNFRLSGGGMGDRMWLPVEHPACVMLHGAFYCYMGQQEQGQESGTHAQTTTRIRYACAIDFFN